MIHSDLIQWIECFAPVELACDWDNVGLMTGNLSDRTKGILFCLDLTLSDIEMAAKSGFNLIVTHHPLIFDKEAVIEESSLLKRKLDLLKESGITVYSAHTNLDFAPGGINDTFLKKLKLTDPRRDLNNHLFGQLPAAESLEDFYDRITADFESFNARLIKPKSIELDDGIVSVAVCCGAFDGETAWLLENRIDVVVTGEMKHSRALELMELGIAAIELGHYETEIPGVKSLASHVKKNVQDQLAQDGVPLKLALKTNPYFDLIGFLE